MGNFLRFLLIFLSAIFVIYLVFQYALNPGPKRLHASAEQGDADAMYKLGRCYYLGKKVERDHDKAFGYIIQAAELGHHEAQIMAGTMYQNGEGTSQNLNEAAKWFDEAARQEVERETPYHKALIKCGMFYYETLAGELESQGRYDAAREMEKMGLYSLILAMNGYHDPQAKRIVEEIIMSNPMLMTELDEDKRNRRGLFGDT